VEEDSLLSWWRRIHYYQSIVNLPLNTFRKQVEEEKRLFGRQFGVRYLSTSFTFFLLLLLLLFINVIVFIIVVVVVIAFSLLSFLCFDCYYYSCCYWYCYHVMYVMCDVCV
jgi:hypothetical protein